MKYIVISDIHGIVDNLPLIKEKSQDCEKIILLGDLYYADYYHRFSNSYNKEFVEEFLISIKDKLICIRGNCDSEEDVKKSSFPIQEGLFQISKNPLIFATHGHLYNEKNWEQDQAILLFGHYHIPIIQKRNDCIYVNPGSISLPRGKEKPSYAILTEKEITIYDIENNVLDSIRL